MKSYFLLLVCILGLVNTILGQSHTIPGASEQPAWIFPIWFANGDGQKDTIYFGYDPSSSIWTNADTVFGEKVIKLDTSKFNSSLCAISSYPDSAFKTMISSDLTRIGFCGEGIIEIFFTHLVKPFTMYWDPLMFYSDSIPFPDQDQAPRAQGRLDYSYSYVDMCSSQFPLLLSDSLSPAGYYCSKKDSIYFENDLGCPPCFGSYTLSITPWSGTIVGLKELSESVSDIYVFPVPAQNELSVQIQNVSEKFFYRVFDISGRILMNGKSNLSNEVINISNLSAGIYLIEIRTDQIKLIKKFTKSNQ